MKEKVFAEFKSLVFDKEEMSKRVDKETLKKYESLLESKESLDKKTADEIRLLGLYRE